MKTMHEKATHESRNILYIYGGLDTWTSCAVNPDPKTNALKYVKYNGGHRTRIRDFGDADKQQMLKALKKWTGCKTNSLPIKIRIPNHPWVDFCLLLQKNNLWT